MNMIKSPLTILEEFLALKNLYSYNIVDVLIYKHDEVTGIYYYQYDSINIIFNSKERCTGEFTHDWYNMMINLGELK